MTRRLPAAVLSVLVLAGLPACATFTNVDRVATVNGRELSRDEFEALADDFFAFPELFQAPPPENGRGSGDAVRSLIGIAAQESLLADVVDETELDAAKQAQLNALPDDDPVREMSPEMQDLFAGITARPELLAAVPVPDAAELERRYDESPASIGVFCVRHILVDTQAEADDVARQLADGADFATLAGEVSADLTTGADGGAVPGSTGPCWTLGEALQGLVPEFVDAAIALRGSAPSAPFESEFGWHIIVHRPWSEVGDAVVATHAEGVTGDVQYVAALLTADVEIDPAYGRWDPATASVVPIGSPRSE